MTQYQASTDPCVLLSQIRDTLARIEANQRPSEFAFAVTATTTGVADLYAPADTYKIARARSITVFLWDENGGIVQFANDTYPEWQMRELFLRGPQAYVFPMVVKSARVRSRSTGAQAEYGLVALL